MSLDRSRTRKILLFRKYFLYLGRGVEIFLEETLLCDVKKVSEIYVCFININILVLN